MMSILFKPGWPSLAVHLDKRSGGSPRFFVQTCCRGSVFHHRPVDIFDECTRIFAREPTRRVGVGITQADVDVMILVIIQRPFQQDRSKQPSSGSISLPGEFPETGKVHANFLHMRDILFRKFPDSKLPDTSRHRNNVRTAALAAKILQPDFT